MAKKNSEPKQNLENLDTGCESVIEESNATPEFSLSIDLPEVSEVDESNYHDSEYGSITESNADDSAENEQKSDTVIGENNPNAVALHEERERSRGIKDDKGREYDPSLHVFPPEKTASGIWKKIPKSQRVVNDSGEVILPTQSNASIKRQAEKVAGWYDNLHLMLFGAEAKATNEQLADLSKSFESYLQESGGIELPPYLDVLFTCVTHSTEVVKRPSVFERLQGRLACWTIKRQFKKLLKEKKISQGQFDQAAHYLSQGLTAFNSWQQSMHVNKGDK